MSNVDELDCNTPRYRRKALILHHHVMNKMYLLHIHLLMYQRTTPLLHYPSNCLFATYLVVFHISANMPDMRVTCIDSLYHCDVITRHWDVGAPELAQVHVLRAFHHNCLTLTTLRPFVSTNPGSLQD